MVNPLIVSAKILHINESLSRIKEKRGIPFDDFAKDRDSQDIVLFNLQIAIQGCIDIASHIVSDNNWKVADTLSSVIDILRDKKVITLMTHQVMRRMVGFRNLIVHEYANLEMKQVYKVLTEHLKDFDTYLKEITLFAKL